MYHAAPSTRRNWWASLTSVVLLLFVLYQTIGYLQPTTSDKAELTAAWEQLRATGSYYVDIELSQTLFPRATAGMIGQQDVQQDLTATGAVVQPDQVTITFTSPDPTQPSTTIVSNGDQTLLQRGATTELVDQSAADTLPFLDPQTFVQATTNVQAIAAAPDTATTRFTFDLDGGKLAQQLSSQALAQLETELPPGLPTTPASMPILQALEGRGEVWLNADGLPVRQILWLDVPEVTPLYNAALKIDMHLSEHGISLQILQPVQMPDGSWSLSAQTVAPANRGGSAPDFSLFSLDWLVTPLVQDHLPGALAVFGALLLCGVVIGAYRRHRRQTTTTISLLLLIVLVTGPLLQQYNLVQFSDAVTAANASTTVEQRFHDELRAATADSPQLQAIYDQATGQPSRFGPIAQTASITPTNRPVTFCGDGSPDEDSDGDGLNDLEEGCLGTDAYSLDTDFDFLTDTLEVDGFTFGGERWYSDPFRYDSNNDGLTDADEWLQPIGNAPAWDSDGDGTPTIWDADNDNDGVSDGVDLGPYAFTPVTNTLGLSLNTQEGDPNRYHYIELQVRPAPEDIDTLRYTESTLDWPDDTNGQITDHDSSTDDLRLIPALRITTNTPPGEEIARESGVSVFSLDDDTAEDRYQLYAPLTPLRDNGQITALQTQVIYDPLLEATTIDWEMELVWMVQAQVDELEGESARVVTESQIAASYPAPFQLTGMQITQSLEAETLLFAAADDPENDTSLIHLLSALTQVFQRAEQIDEKQRPGRTALREMFVRFNEPFTPPEDKFGIPTQVQVVVDYEKYTHAQQSRLDVLQNRIPALLENNGYAETECRRAADDDPFPCGSVVLASEETTAFVSLDSFAQSETLEVAAGLAVNLDSDQFLDITTRSLQLLNYAREGGDWQPQTLDEILAVMDQRYDYVQLAADLEEDFPGITERELRYVTILNYLNWHTGLPEITGIDGVPLFDPTLKLPDDEVLDLFRFWGLNMRTQLPAQAANLFFDGISERRISQERTVAFDNNGLERLDTVEYSYNRDVVQSGITRLRIDIDEYFLAREGPSYFIDEGRIVRYDLQPDGSYERIIEGGGITFDSQLISPEDAHAFRRMRLGSGVSAFGVSVGLAGAAVLAAATIASVVCQEQENEDCTEWANAAGVGSTVLVLVGNVLERTGDLVSGSSRSAVSALRAQGQTFSARFSRFTTQSRLARSALIFSLVADVGLAIGLVVYASFNVDTAQERALILAYAFATITVSVLLFTLSLIPGVGLIIALFLLVDFLQSAFTGFSVIGEFTDLIRRFFLDYEEVTRVESVDLKGGEFTFEPPEGVLLPPEGPVANNTLVYQDEAHTTFALVNDRYTWGEEETISTIRTTIADKSYADLLLATASSDGVTDSVNNDDADICDLEEGVIIIPAVGGSGSRIDTSCSEARFRFDRAAINAELELDVKIKGSFVYLERVLRLPGLRTDGFELPDPEDEEQSQEPAVFHLDVLPNTLQGLWSWWLLTNPDRDGDGLTNNAEAEMSSNADTPDTDGDGLWDGFESNRLETSGTDLRKADSDDDGVGDRQEVAWGLQANRSDTDNDGLADAQEGLTGSNGWDVVLPSGRVAHVFPDPLSADTDLDGIPDAEERESGLSPHAPNIAPLLLLSAAPQAIGPDGNPIVLVTPGDEVTVTLELLSTGRIPVTETLSLCLPRELTTLSDVQPIRTNGAPVPPLTTNPECAPDQSYAWSFTDPDQIEPLALRAGEAITTTLAAQVNNVTESVSTTIRAQLPYSTTVINRSVPLRIDVDPPAVAITAPTDGALLRGASYVVGGTATDPTSWIDRVSFTTDQPAATSQETTPEDGRWAATWELPADGRYTLTAQATDAVGEQSPTDSVQVTVDNTAPTIALDPALFADGFLTALEPQGTSVALTGAASDALSGLSRLQLQINDQPWQDIALADGFPNDATWSYDWQLAGTNADGAYQIQLRAVDRAGNVSALPRYQVTLDQQAPGITLLTDRYTDEELTFVNDFQNLDLTGIVDDLAAAPLQPHPVELTGELDALEAATVWLEFDTLAETQGVQVTWLGDINGDSRGDFAVGMPQAANGAGRVAMVAGQAGDWQVPPTTEFLSDAFVEFLGVPGAGLGTQVTSAGDVNGDGLYDILIGDPTNQRVFLVYGRPGLSGRSLLLDTSQPGQWVELTSTDPSITFGNQQQAAGDVNGDGYDDLLLVGTGAQAAVYLLAGRRGGWAGLVDVPPFAAATHPLGPEGVTVSGVGDVDADGYADLAIAYPAATPSDTSGVYLYTGTPAFAEQAQLALSPRSATAHLTGATGQQLAALGDVNGDDRADFAYGDDTGATWLVLGRSDAAWDNGRDLSAFFTELGGFLVAPGDVNADGLDDLLLGTTTAHAYLVNGRADLGTATLSAAATLTGVGGAASSPYRAGADLNCDRSADLLLLPAELLNPGYATTDLGYGTLPPISIDDLPYAPPPATPLTGVAAPPVTPPAAFQLAVDDDYCDAPTCTNDGYVFGETAFTTIQAAVDVAPPGTQITIRPGTYSGFALDGQHDIRIVGVNPDAVFIEGPGTLAPSHVVSMTNARAITLTGLTIRGGPNGIGLARSGEQSYAPGNEDTRIILDRLLITGYSTAGVAFDRFSTADIRRVTLAGAAGSTAIWVDPDVVDEEALIRWKNSLDNPDDVASLPEQPEDNGRSAATPNGDYAFLGTDGTERGFARYDATANTWNELTNAPFVPAVPLSNLMPLNNGDDLTVVAEGNTPGLDGIVYDMATISSGANTRTTYVGGRFAQVRDTSGTLITVNNIASLTTIEESRQFSQTWAPLGGGVLGEVQAVDVIANDVYVGGDLSWAVNPDGSLVEVNNLARWDGTNWYAVGQGIDGTVLAIDAFEDANDRTLVSIGGDFAASPGQPNAYMTIWDQAADTWLNLPDTPLLNDPVRALYYLRGTFSADYHDLYVGSGCNVLRYDPETNSWDQIPFDVQTISCNNSNNSDVGVHSIIQMRSGFVSGGAAEGLVIGGLFEDSVLGVGTSRTILAFNPDIPCANNCIRAGVAGDPNRQPNVGIVRDLEERPVGDSFTLDRAVLAAAGDEGVDWFGFRDRGTPNYPSGFSPLVRINGGANRAVYALSRGNFEANMLVGGNFTSVTYSYNLSGSDTSSVNGLFSGRYIGGGNRTTVYLTEPTNNDVTVRGGVTQFPRYSFDGSSWSVQPFIAPSGATATASNGNDVIYSLYESSATDNQTLFSSYTTSADAWEPLPPLPTDTGPDSILVEVAGATYVAADDTGQSFYRFTPGANSAAGTWTALEPVPFAIGSGASLVWDQADALYIVQGGNGRGFARFDLTTDTWEDLTSTSTPQVSTGGGLTYQDDYLRAFEGNESIVVWQYGPLSRPTPTKLTLEDVAFVAPDSAAAAAWSNLPPTGAPDFLLARDPATTWVNGASTTWRPALPPDTTPLDRPAAAFLAEDQGLYRIQPTSALQAGYHRNLGTAVVGPAFCDGCPNEGLVWGETAFTSIQAAINSGASTVRLLPGRYQEPLFLAHGVSLVGASAEHTLLTAPPGRSPAALVTAQGVRHAQLAQLTLVGTNQGAGVVAHNSQLTLYRAIVRATTTGLTLTGPQAQGQVQHVTLVANTTGIVAADCDRITVANSVLAYHSQTGLQYQTCERDQPATYNAYWANGSSGNAHLQVGATVVAPTGVGTVNQLAPPRFVNRTTHTYRLMAGSPLLAAGAPTPGGRPDIGYWQHQGAALLVDDAFCDPATAPAAQDCPNAGRLWGVDAFAAIQPAIDVAAVLAPQLVCPTTDPEACSRLTIQVRPGVYPERLTLASHLRLLGGGGGTDPATASIIDGQGQGSVVTLAGVVNTEVRGFTIQHAGGGPTAAGVTVGAAERYGVPIASRQVTLSQLLLRNNQHGVRVAAGAQASLAFSTIVASRAAGALATDAGTALTVRNTLLAQNAVGLQTRADGLLVGNYNLLATNTIAYDDPTGAAPGADDLHPDNPGFRDAAAGDYRLRPTSPAVNAAEPARAGVAQPQPGGGRRADIGYQELLVVPLTLLLGTLGAESCAIAPSGVAQLELGAAFVPTATSPVSTTQPTTWTPLVLDTPGAPASFWTAAAPALAAAPDDGLYRLYGRSRDQAGNQLLPGRFLGAVVLDTTAPTIRWPDGAAPTGPLTAAALPLEVEVFDTTDVGGQAVSTLDQVFFTLGGRRYPAQPVGTPAVGWHRYRGWVPLLPGPAPTLTVQALDRAGNLTHQATPLPLTTPAPVAAITAPQAGGAVPSATVQVQGYARFPAGAGAHRVQVLVNGTDPVLATLTTPTAAGSFWQAQVPLTPGTNTLTVQAAQGTTVGPLSAPLTLVSDPVAPQLGDLTVTLTAGQAHLSGSAVDVNRDTALPSGLAAVAVSLDIGCSWQPATLAGERWSVTVDLPTETPQVRLTLLVRATDQAGNTLTVPRTVTIDTTLLTSVEPVRFNIPPEGYATTADSLTMTWQDPGPGDAVTVAAVMDQQPATVPTVPTAGPSLTQPFTEAGTWYAHLAVRDAAGNTLLNHYGPWYVGASTPDDRCVAARPLTLDGRLATDRNEWNVTTELLDDAERQGGRQELFATWDADALYLGWRGAQWALDGQLVAYLALGAGGSTRPLPGHPGALPLTATDAVVIDDATTGTHWRFQDGRWQQGAPLAFATDPNRGGGTEVRLPLPPDAAANLGLFALALTEAQVPWAVFPTTNPLDPAGWTTAYQWSDRCGVAAPNANQPQSRTATLQLTSDQRWHAPGETLTTRLTVQNGEYDEPLTTAVVELVAPAGLRYQAVAGVPCADCVPGATRWPIALPPIGARGSISDTLTFTLTAQLDDRQAAAPSTRESRATLLVPALAPYEAVATTSTAHRVDPQPPLVTIAADLRVRPGPSLVQGTVTDQNQSGVRQVQVRLAGTHTWHPAVGRSVWQAPLAIPASPTVVIEARAQDQVGTWSTPVRAVVVVDTAPPTVDVALPARITTRSVVVAGTAQDPNQGAITQVALQVRAPSPNTLPDAATPGGPGLRWNAAVLQPATGTPPGATPWRYLWRLPALDGEVLQLRARATDQVGNRSQVAEEDWQTTLVDNVAPLITVTQQLTRVQLAARPTGPILAGTVGDGAGVAAVQVRLIWPDERETLVAAERTGTSWQLAGLELAAGHYRLQVEAVDTAGNVGRTLPQPLTVTTGAVALRVGSDSPTEVGQPTRLTATINGGAPTTYVWDLGEGSTARGATVQHTYRAVGRYTAQVTATNRWGRFTASTVVEVVAGPAGGPPRVYLPLLRQGAATPAAPAADLLVSAIALTPDTRRFRAGEPVALAITLTNRGDEPTRRGFWVDLFIDPAVPPSAEQRPVKWDDTCGSKAVCLGIAWQVDQVLAPGEQVTLVSTAATESEPGQVGYAVAHTIWPGWFAAGTEELYVYIDAWSLAGEPLAFETDTRNNRAELRGLTVTGQNPPLPPPASGGDADARTPLPQRASIRLAE